MSENHICPQCHKEFHWGNDGDSGLAIASGGPSCAENAYWKLQGHIEEAHPETGFLCPRRVEAGARWPGKDHWGMRNGWRTCSYCGSLHPDDLFKCIDEGTCEISGTDKNYKIYVEVPNSNKGKYAVISSSTHPHEGCSWEHLTKERCKELELGSYAESHYVGQYVQIGYEGDMAHMKLYFQHFTVEHQNKFIELYNAKKLPLEPRFGMYRTPYFASPK